MLNFQKQLQRLALTFLALNLAACASQPKRGFELPVALSEVYRGGQLKGLEYADGPDLGMPNQYDRVSHTCTSTPIYTLEGYYSRTVVHCQ